MDPTKEIAMKSKDSIVEYEFVRAVAVLLVILGHCNYYIYGMDVPPSTGTSIVNIVTSILYHFHMPLFMALSGCLFYYGIKKKGLTPFSPFVKKKMKRLIVPFLTVTTFFAVPIYVLSDHYLGLPIKIDDIIQRYYLMFKYTRFYMWFLQALFLIFIVAWGIEKHHLRRNPYVFFLVLLVVSAIGRYMRWHELNLLNISQAMMYLVWFYCGFYFEKYRMEANRFIKKRLPLTAIFVFILLYCLIEVCWGTISACLPFSRLVGYAYYYVMAFLGIALTYSLCYRLINITPPIC